MNWYYNNTAKSFDTHFRWMDEYAAKDTQLSARFGVSYVYWSAAGEAKGRVAGGVHRIRDQQQIHYQKQSRPESVLGGRGKRLLYPQLLRTSSTVRHEDHGHTQESGAAFVQTVAMWLVLLSLLPSSNGGVLAARLRDRHRWTELVDSQAQFWLERSNRNHSAKNWGSLLHLLYVRRRGIRGECLLFRSWISQ